MPPIRVVLLSALCRQRVGDGFCCSDAVLRRRRRRRGVKSPVVVAAAALRVRHTGDTVYTHARTSVTRIERLLEYIYTYACARAEACPCSSRNLAGRTH